MPTQAPLKGTLEGPNQDHIRRELELLTRWMDDAFEIPGIKWRFGLDAIIGLVPAVGDMITTAISLYIMSRAAQLGVSRLTLARMGLNVAIDGLLGSVPFVGDIFDTWWKANRMNMNLLENRMELPHDKRRQANWIDGAIVVVSAVVVVAILVGAILLSVYLAGLLYSAVGSSWRAATN